MRRIALGFLLGAVVGAGAARVLSASKATERPSVSKATEDLRSGDVITGVDLGFRVERIESKQVVGTLVVQLNGEWKESAPPQRVIPARP